MHSIPQTSTSDLFCLFQSARALFINAVTSTLSLVVRAWKQPVMKIRAWYVHGILTKVTRVYIKFLALHIRYLTFWNFIHHLFCIELLDFVFVIWFNCQILFSLMFNWKVNVSQIRSCVSVIMSFESWMTYDYPPN